MMTLALNILAIALLAYLIGSIPFAILVTRLKAGVDVRSVGSGHAGATKTMRAAGWGAAFIVLLLDLSKGWAVFWLARRMSIPPWTLAIAVGMVVIGHCWPLFAGFRGGMGMACATGCLVAAWPFGLVLAVGLAVSLQLLIRHSARANFLTGLLLGPVWIVFGAQPQLAVLASAAGIVISIRALSDWDRVYRELWLDREG